MKMAFLKGLVCIAVVVALFSVSTEEANARGNKEPWSITYSKCYNDLTSNCIPSR